MLLDTTRFVETPEGVSLSLRVAGPIPRSLAWLLDQAIRVAMYTAFGMAMSMLGEAGNGPLMVLIFLTEWFYPVAFEVLRSGQTPGKQVMRLAVVRDDGRPVDLESSLIRNLLRTADFLPLAYFFGLSTMVCSTHFQRLGDHAARTMVVYVDRPTQRPALAEVTPHPPPVPLTLEEKRAIIDFASRSQRWTTERTEEIAVLAQPTFSSPSALIATARWLLGKR